MQHSLNLISTEDDGLPLVPYDLPSKEIWNGIAVVGEAPGNDEVKLGHPFVGRSGQLLNEILTEAGINRKECLIANVFRLKPPKNKVDHFFISKRSAQQQQIDIAERYGQFGSLWCRKEYEKELSYLKSVLSKWQPSVIVSLGRTPLWALTGKNGILGLVGQQLSCTLLNNDMPVIPSFHPSFIIRGNWNKRPEFVAHLEKAKKLLHHSGPHR